MSLAIYVSNQKLYESAGVGEFLEVAAATLTVQSDDRLRFCYVMKPGQYARVQNLDSGMVVRIDE